MKKILCLLGCLLLGSSAHAQTDAVVITDFSSSGTQRSLQFSPQPGIETYTILSATNLNDAFTPNPTFVYTPFYSTNSLLVTNGDFIIDNQQAALTASWSVSSSAADRFRDDYRYRGPGTGANWVEFRPTIPVAGDYDVYEWHSQGSNRTSKAPHLVKHGSVTDVVYVDQRSQGGRWNLLGRFYCPAGNLSNVRITDNFTGSGTVVIADAIRFVAVVPPPAETTNVMKIAGYEWRGTSSASQGFYRVAATPLSSNELLTGLVLNRLAYGPTPDELERVRAIGPQNFINEQLNFELLDETALNSHTNLPFIEAKFAASNEVVDYKFTQSYTTNTNSIIVTNNTVSSTNASIADFKAWHILRAVGAKRQLLEVLLQFWENHFVTQYSKSSTYLNRFYNGDKGVMEDRLAAQMEYLENDRWRTALLNPNCTFYDLLRISAESPAMIIYLDTVDSRGDRGRIPNENYAREVLELFTFGVDNGYDQNDITIMSRCWAGWTVGKVDPANVGNPFAPSLSLTGAGFATNTSGVWTFLYDSTHQNTNAQTVFAGKTVPARFGAPWAGRNYQLTVPKRIGTNGIQGGYDVIAHLANQPFTEEFLSVKLCRIFVHDNFAHGYDFSDTANLSPEGQLVKQCMLAWETPGPDGRKGNIRAVLSTIFNSSLFQSQSAAHQKIKTPIEFCVSAIRALRSSTNGTFAAGSFTSDTDGYSISGSTITTRSYPLSRMGTMLLFDRNDPNGYPENGDGWISGGTLAERVRFIQTYLMASSESGRSDGISGGNKNMSDPVALLGYKLPLQNPPGDLNNSTNVADYFVGILFPGDGKANLALYRDAAVHFLDTADDGITSSPLGNLSQTGNPSPYENRVRGMVSMLMTLPRFQEQ